MSDSGLVDLGLYVAFVDTSAALELHQLSLETNMLSSAVNRARAARKNESGFTLIELLIVIVILGILAGIVVFSVSGITDRGDKSACKANIATIDVAVEAYYAQSGSYPISDANLSPAFMKSNPPAGYITYGTASTPPTVKLQSTC